MRHSRRLDLGFVLVLGLAARITYLVIWGGLDAQLHDSLSDQFIYLDIADNLAEGDGFTVSGETWIADPGQPTSIMPPLYPLVLGGLFKLWGHSILAARLLGLALSCLVPVFAYLIAERLQGRRAGLLAGAVAALYPPLVMYARPLMSEAIFLPLLGLLAYITLRLLDDRPSPVTWLTWGVVAALAILTRTEAGLLVPALMGFVLIARYRRFRLDRAALVRRWLLSLVALGLVLSPYSLYNYQAHGNPMPLPNAKWKMWDHTWLADARTRPEWQGVGLPERQIVPDWEDKTERERDAYLWKLAVKFVRENPGTYAEQRIRRVFWSYPLLPLEELREPQPSDGAAFGSTSLDDTVRYATPAERIRVWSFRAMFLGALAGFVYYALARRDSRFLVLGIFIAWNVVHSALFVGSERLRIQIDLFLIVLTAAALISLWYALKDRGRLKREEGGALSLAGAK